jgi:hypothetical protein
MVPKADRILDNLPPTFTTLGDPSALRALADGYGGELQAAENGLVAVMRSHWVDFADAGERTVLDLAGIGALYGLAPRPDESVEEFREHLKRYVRTLLEGTVTVRGILRITAEVLGLHIDDESLDAWWTRDDPVLVSTFPRGVDAATLVLGTPAVERFGRDEQPAAILGDVDLRAGVDLRTRDTLRIAIDTHGALPVQLAAEADDAAAVRPDEIVDAINAMLGSDGQADLVDGRLQITSASTGADAEVLIADGPDDAADLVLGLRSRSYQGVDATHARLTGTPDLSTPVDLTTTRYLRIDVDGNHLAEIDCAAAADDPAGVDVADITMAINDALGISVAGDDGRFLTLTSPTPGRAGYIAVLTPAAQDATAPLLGTPPPFTFGTDARTATAVGDRDLGAGVDLQETPRLRLAVDDEPAVTLDLLGVDPTATTPAEIVASVNEGLGAPVASHDGSRVTLSSGTAGSQGALTVEEVTGDAAEAVLGLRPRRIQGKPPSTASVTGTVDVSGGVDLSARNRLLLSVDGGAPVEVDLLHGIEDPTDVSVDELVDAVNHALGATDEDIAVDDGAHLILVSPTEGAGGSIVVRPLVEERRRRFVTRARVTDDAATAVLGFTARRATGTAADVARILGTTDLGGGANLTVNRYLRILLDDRAAEEVDCAGPRPRATTPAEIVTAINTKVGVEIASTDGRRISLVAPTPGAGSLLALEPPRSLDALDRVLGIGPVELRGAPPTGVRLTGTVDLSAGVELVADATLRITVDANPPVDVPVGDGTAATTRSLSAIVAAINQALVAQVAGSDGSHLLLVSPSTGTTSRIALGPPSTGTDATSDLLGFAAPRAYHGAAATAAEVSGTKDLTAGEDVRTEGLLRISVDGGEPVVVDLSEGAADPEHVDASAVATAINSATTAVAATRSIPGGVSVRIASPSTGLSSRLDISRTGSGDAAPLIFGAAGVVATGSAPGPAVLDGDVDLLAPVDLSDRSVLRIAVDGAPPVDVDVAGAAASTTLLGEIVAALDAVVPGLASATDDQRLRLTSPTEGLGSAVEVVPLRFLEVIEYPSTTAEVRLPVRHGLVLPIRNSGAAAVSALVAVSTGVGVCGPRVADPSAGWSVRVDEAVGAGGGLDLAVGPDGALLATITEHGTTRTVPPENLEISGTGALEVRRGLNRWSWSECRAARFDQARFDVDAFPGGPCSEEAVFDLSRFGPASDWAHAVFAESGERATTAEVTVRWDSHTAGGFAVNLPLDLGRRFGVAFGERANEGSGLGSGADARFGTETPELYAGVVTEPDGDPDHIELRVNQTRSKLIEAALVPVVPIGWAAVAMPFRDPTPLTLGTRDREARLYLSEPGLAPQFLLLRAAEPGTWGNDLTVTCRAAGPAIYDLAVTYPGGRFENARQTVFGPELPTLADALLEPGPVGVGTAKAAGVHAEVTRDGVAAEESTHREEP